MFKLTIKTKLYSYEKIGTYEELMHILEDLWVPLAEVKLEEVV